jgi:hypothetical protein
VGYFIVGFDIDPVIAAIVTAVAASLASGASKIVERALGDAYRGLRALLSRKYGEDSGVVKSVERLEGKPGSSARREVLKEEVAEVQADQDREIIQAAQALLDKLPAQPSGEELIHNAVGNYIAQSAQGSTATVSVNRPKE